MKIGVSTKRMSNYTPLAYHVKPAPQSLSNVRRHPRAPWRARCERNGRDTVIDGCTPLLGASPLALAAKNGGERTERFVDRLAVGEHVENLRIDHHDV